jgi:hypothetical protein
VQQEGEHGNADATTQLEPCEEQDWILVAIDHTTDQVVVFYFINDAEPVPQKARFPGLGRSRTLTFFWSRLMALRARFSETTGYREYYSALYREGSAGWRKTQDAFLRLRDLSATHGFTLSVVLLPELHELNEYAFAKEHAQVMKFLSEIGVPALNLAVPFRDQPDPSSLWVSRDDAHPNARAHRLISEYSLDFIAEAGS